MRFYNTFLVRDDAICPNYGAPETNLRPRCAATRSGLEVQPAKMKRVRPVTFVNRRWILRRRPDGAIGAEDLEFVAAPIADLRPGEVLVRNIYLSLNPTHRIWMSDRDQYMAPVAIGEVMRGGTTGVVEASLSQRYAPGDLVTVGMGGWELYTVAAEAQVSRVRRAPGIPLTATMSVLGGTGLTAYFGMTDVARPTPGGTVVVTAAAGAVGSVAGQIARIMGARVVGICGSSSKRAWLESCLGFEGAVDYRNEDVGAALDRLCPDGIDVAFENVGGAILDAILPRMNNFGRIAVCGLISTYNSPPPVLGPTDFDRVLMRRLTLRGFIISDYFPRAREGFDALSAWVADGRILWKDHVVAGLENAVAALGLLFTGEHDGKLLVQISEEP